MHRLADMEENGIVSRTEYEGKVPKVEYSLTAAGADSFADSAAGLNVSLTCRCRKFNDT